MNLVGAVLASKWAQPGGTKKMSSTLSSHVPADLCIGKDVPLECPDWAFRPDAWTFAFARGLRHVCAGWEGKDVWEVGVGTGAGILLLSPFATAARWFVSDFNPEATQLAVRNIERSGRVNGALRPLHGRWNLTKPETDVQRAPEVDVLFACIPQVPSQDDLSVGDRLANYYDPALVAGSQRNSIGLGLVEGLLVEARRVLKPKGTVILNLGGRPGIYRLRSLFADTGYCCQTLHAEVIPQHEETSLAALADREAAGEADFEFFLDPAASKRINARHAEELRRKKTRVYHRIYVIAGTIA